MYLFVLAIVLWGKLSPRLKSWIGVKQIEKLHQENIIAFFETLRNNRSLNKTQLNGYLFLNTAKVKYTVLCFKKRVCYVG